MRASIHFCIQTAFLCLFVSYTTAQTVVNGSITGAPVGNSALFNATGWSNAGFSPDLCDVSFPSFSGIASENAVASPDGGAWLGLASIGESAQTTITGLTVGQDYTLEFYSACFGTGSILDNGPATPIVHVGGQSFDLVIPKQGDQWQTKSLSFVAQSTTETLVIEAPSVPMTAGYYVSFDGFRVYQPIATVLEMPELLSFEGQATGQGTELTWKVNNAKEIKHFEIEESRDGVSFTSIGNVDAEAAQEKYNFTSLVPHTQIMCYYRLRMETVDGAYEYSEILALQVEEALMAQIQLFPNPASDQLNIILPKIAHTNTSTTWNVAIYSATGMPVKEYKTVTFDEVKKLEVDVHDLPTGSYWVYCQSDCYTTCQRAFQKIK